MMFGRRITAYSLDHYKSIAILTAVATVVLGAFFPLIKVDTDPENMLAEDAPVRIFHHKTKQDFVLSDIVVLGIVNNKHPLGVFNVASLTRIYELTEFAKTWRSVKDPNQGVVEVDLLAPSLVDHISQGEPGVIRFEWLMPKPPATELEAAEIRDKVMSNPLLFGTIVSEDGKALCLYIPITTKNISHELYKALSDCVARFQGDEEYHITGLPVAEDTFGHEMFLQMAISAPLAMLVIFLLMLLFFRKLILVVAPMIVAIVSVIATMGLLIGFGFSVHIMSSMIPIFLMPISVTDSVHVLSAFFDQYTKEKGRKETIIEVMGGLFTPMLYTSLTSAAGFLSLALTPIPPVQVFGVFVAIGVIIAWVVTMTFVPAYIMLLNEKRLAGFGAASAPIHKDNAMTRWLRWTGSFTCRAAKPIVAALVILTAIGIYGITKIQINDNPTKWFSTGHPIRKADIELNRHFGGTYMAYLVLEDAAGTTVDANFVAEVRRQVEARAGSWAASMRTLLVSPTEPNYTKVAWLEALEEKASAGQVDANDAQAEAWAGVAAYLEQKRQSLDTFHEPQALNYVSGLQEHLNASGLVGKSSSVADIVKKVHKELLGGEPDQYRIPGSGPAVAQCLEQFQSSHTPDDLWHFITIDSRKANLWLQLRSGDNKDMERVVAAVDAYFAAHKPPVPMRHQWAGLTYINIVWQREMVWGMIQSLLGSFFIVFMMMAILFRSPLWGLICMVPLSFTIIVIYGMIGLLGKDYDMPVAVLSALTLGMAVDFAIHFLDRAKIGYQQAGSWHRCAADIFEEPARAITRNVMVIAIGFLPLLAAPLVPYRTVGIFLCAIMALSGLSTLLILPAILTVIEKRVFGPAKAAQSALCNCGLCLTLGVAGAVVVALNVGQFGRWPVSKMAWFSLILIPIAALICGVLSRRRACKRAAPVQGGPCDPCSN